MDSCAIPGCTMNTYTADTLVRMFAVITAVLDGQLIDPTAIAAKIKAPDGTITDLSTLIVHDSLGTFHVDYVPTVTGLFQYEWLCSGNVQLTRGAQFLVNRGLF